VCGPKTGLSRLPLSLPVRPKAAFGARSAPGLEAAYSYFKTPMVDPHRLIEGPFPRQTARGDPDFVAGRSAIYRLKNEFGIEGDFGSTSRLKYAVDF
jgi:hypothetical protein